MAAGADIREPSTGAHPSVRNQPAELAEIAAIKRPPRLWQRLLRFFRLEEAILLALLGMFVVAYLLIEGGPTAEELWQGFAYNFHGRGTFWLFTLWCVLGTGFLLLVAAAPLAAKGKVSDLMNGVWGSAATPWQRLRSTTMWGIGGLRAYVPFMACMGVYEMNKRLIPAIRGETLYDIPMAKLEYAMFGDLTSAMVYKFMHQQWITDLIGLAGLRQIDIHEACYISYVYAAPALALALWFLGRRMQFDRFMGALAITGALAYVGYVIVPVVGPKYVFEGRWLEATQGALAFMDDIKDRNRDCFPSLHTAWTTLFLMASWKGVRPLFWVYLPAAIGVYIATFYGGYHYFPDIIAGHALAVFAWWAAKPLRGWWDRAVGRQPAPV